MRAETLYRAVPFLFLGSFAIGWFQPMASVGVGDWDQFFCYAWVSVRGLLERGMPPAWTIQFAGGAPLAADPQTLSHSPLLVFPLVFGPIVGTKLVTVLSIAAGIVGAQRLGERWIGDALGAAVFSFVLVFSGYFAIHLRAGHFPWAAFHLVPWILLFADRILFENEGRTRDSIGFLAALTLLFAGTVYQPLVYFLLPLGFAYGLTLRRETRPAARRHLLLLVSCAFLLTFPRWLAIIEWEIGSPRSVVYLGGMPLFSFVQMLVTPIDDYKHRVPWGGSGIWEYWSYVGIPATTLALLSLRRPSAVRRLAVACLALATVLVWRGAHGNALAWIAPHLPFFSSVRVYSRFTGLAVFAIALLAGMEIARMRREPRATWLAVLFSVLIVADYGVFTRPIWARVFSLSPAELYPDWGVVLGGEPYAKVRLAPRNQPLVDDRDAVNSRMLPLLMAGAVVSNAYVTTSVPGSRPPPGPTVEAPAGTVVRVRNHALDLSGDFTTGQRILVRLRYAKRIWKVSDRTAARLEHSRDGMRIVILRPCRQVRVVLRRGGEMFPWVIAALGALAAAIVVRRAPFPRISRQ